MGTGQCTDTPGHLGDDGNPAAGNVIVILRGIVCIIVHGYEHGREDEYEAWEQLPDCLWRLDKVSVRRFMSAMILVAMRARCMMRQEGHNSRLEYPRGWELQE